MKKKTLKKELKKNTPQTVLEELAQVLMDDTEREEGAFAPGLERFKEAETE